MSGDVEGIADIATGALIARAIEGNGRPGGLAERQCLNCGTALVGSHCHACGQPAHVHRSLGAIWHDLAHGVFHFEGKLWRTLPMLVVRPGELTRRYIDGERSRFFSPLALFLFTVFIMFGMMSALGMDLASPRMSAEQRANALKVVEVQKSEALAARTEIDARIAAARSAGTATDDIAKERRALNTSIRALDQGIENLKDDGAVNFTDLHTGWARLDKGIEKANANPGLLLYKLQSSAYKFSWALIPLSVPLMALLFLWRRGHHLYDHTVFVTYSLCFMSLLVIVLSIGGELGVSSDIGGLLIMLAPPLHMYRQLRGTYRLRPFSAIWRTVALLVFANFTLVMFVLLMLGLGLIG